MTLNLANYTRPDLEAHLNAIEPMRDRLMEFWLKLEQENETSKDVTKEAFGCLEGYLMDALADLNYYCERLEDAKGQLSP